jgi:hypothetical protein
MTESTTLAALSIGLSNEDTAGRKAEEEDDDTSSVNVLEVNQDEQDEESVLYTTTSTESPAAAVGTNTMTTTVVLETTTHQTVSKTGSVTNSEQQTTLGPTEANKVLDSQSSFASDVIDEPLNENVLTHDIKSPADDERDEQAGEVTTSTSTTLVVETSTDTATSTLRSELPSSLMDSALIENLGDDAQVEVVQESLGTTPEEQLTDEPTPLSTLLTDAQTESTTEVLTTKSSSTVPTTVALLRQGNQPKEEEESLFMSKLPTRQSLAEAQGPNRAAVPDEAPKQESSAVKKSGNQKTKKKAPVQKYSGTFSRPPPFLESNNKAKVVADEVENIAPEKSNNDELDKLTSTNEPETTTNEPTTTEGTKVDNQMLGGFRATSDIQGEPVEGLEAVVTDKPDAQQEVKRSEPDSDKLELPEQVVVKQDDVLAAIYGLLGATGPTTEQLSEKRDEEKLTLRKRKANNLDLVTDATEVPESVTKTATNAEQNASKQALKMTKGGAMPGVHFRTIEPVVPVREQETPLENRVS